MTIKEIDNRLKEVDKEHAALLEAVEDVRKAEKTAYNNLLQTMAEKDVGDSTKKDVESAEKSYEKAVESHKKTRLELDAKERALELLKEKRNQAINKRKAELQAEIQKELPNVLQPIFDALDALDNANENLEAFRNKYANSVMGAPEADKHVPKPLRLYTAKTRVPGSDLGRIVDPIEKWRQEFQSIITKDK
jgi:DNA repair exonuclease SbcCD ATPase subunit